jgi:hypothetical protein
VHNDAIVAMSNALSKAMQREGYVGTRVYPAIDNANDFGHSTVYFVVYLPVDVGNAAPSWPDALVALPHPTLPAMTRVVAHIDAPAIEPAPQTNPVTAQPKTETNVAPFTEPSPVSDAQDNTVVDIDSISNDSHSAVPTPAPEPAPEPAPGPGVVLVQKPTPLPPPQPTPIAKPARPTLPTGAHAINAVKASWSGGQSWYPDLRPMMDAPIRMRATSEGYHAYTGRGSLIVSTPALLVGRQGSMLHHDAMRAIGKALQDALAKQGFVGTRVQPACTKPDARGFRTLHLTVSMPVEGGKQQPLPASLLPLPAHMPTHKGDAS